MNTSKPTVAELFRSPIHYVVPWYQREYVWEEDDQWSPLWDDLIRVAEKHINKPSAPKPHFLGAIVLKQKPSSTGKAAIWEVVDGQQRLTTLQVVIAATADEVEKAGCEDVAQSLRQLTINDQLSQDGGDQRFKLKPSANDVPAFHDAVDGSGNIHPDRADARLSQCYKFFRGEVSGWIYDAGTPSAKRIDALFAALWSSLQTVNIELESDEDEQMIFETLNARGTPLGEWDKVRNFMLLRVNSRPEDEQKSFFDSYVEPFNDEWWQQESRQGSFGVVRASTFIDYWLESQLLRPVAANRVYREFQDFVEHCEGDVDSTAEKMLSMAKRFQKLETWPDDDSIDYTFHKRRHDLKVGVLMPLLLRLYSAGCDETELHLCLRSIESALVRRLIAGWSTRRYNTLFIDLLRRISDSKGWSRPSHVLIDTLKPHWPDDDLIREKVLNTPAYASLPQYKVRLILTAIENHLIPSGAGYQLVGNLTIEHVLPNRWSLNWPLNPRASQEEIQERDRIKHTLGNLTLLHQKTNIGSGNSGWEEKRKRLKANDNLFLNKELLDHAGDTWNEGQIEARGERLTKIMMQIWPNGDMLKREFESN